MEREDEYAKTREGRTSGLTLVFFLGLSSSSPPSLPPRRSSSQTLGSLGGALAFPPPFLPLLGSLSLVLGFSSLLSALLFFLLLSLNTPLLLLSSNNSSLLFTSPSLDSAPAPRLCAWMSAIRCCNFSRNSVMVGAGPSEG